MKPVDAFLRKIRSILHDLAEDTTLDHFDFELNGRYSVVKYSFSPESLHPKTRYRRAKGNLYYLFKAAHKLEEQSLYFVVKSFDASNRVVYEHDYIYDIDTNELNDAPTIDDSSAES